MPLIVGDRRGVETDMTKGRDTQSREAKKKPGKTLKEKRADKAAKKDGTFKPDSIGKKLGSSH
jgi:hypothetical protein